MEPFDPLDLGRLAHGSPRQRAAHAALASLDILTALADCDATLAGTLPLGCDIEDSDLDIICHAADLAAFAARLAGLYSHCDGFHIERLDVRGVPSLVASFCHGDFRVEVFAQDVPVAEQNAVQHLQSEALLLAHDPAAVEPIRALKRQGLSTEEAFCAHFAIPGDPYAALLDPVAWARRLTVGSGGPAPPSSPAAARADGMGAAAEVDAGSGAVFVHAAVGDASTAGSGATLARSNRIMLGDNLPLLRALPAGSVDLVYIDPPFNTGETQQRVTLRSERAEDEDEGAHVGFGGRRYRSTRLGEHAYADAFDDYLAFLQPRLEELHRVLAPHGTLYVHLDYREVHYVKVLLDGLFGRSCFLNEIIWAYDYGGRTRRKWPPKHDTILVYVKDPRRYTFNVDAVDRVPYMAPELVGAEKAARGKSPTDTWWHTIVPTAGKEKTGYPTQKPLGILRRIILASSNPGDLVLDCFAGSGTTGAACLELGRRFLLMDDNPAALTVMRRRFAGVDTVRWETETG